ncbi:MAG: AMP-binding protein [Halieaceae bacterium]|nr:AMP-binding protein [Halieaceae bacterium]
MVSIGAWKIAEADPERVAVIGADGAKSTFHEVASKSNQLARALKSLCLQKGDRLAMMMTNSAEMLEVTLAALQTGFYIVPINFHSTANEVAFIIRNSNSKAFFIDRDFATTEYLSAIDEAGISETLRFATKSCFGFSGLDDLRDDYSSIRPDETVAGSVMFYTSGTTGRPKGVLRALPAADGDSGAEQQVWLFNLFGIEPAEGVHLVNSPFYHSAVFNLGMAALHSGQTLILLNDWEAEKALSLIDRYKVTSTHMVTTHFHRFLLLSKETKHKYQVDSLRHVIHGAVPTPVEIKSQILDWWGPVVFEYYGSSEVGATIASPQDWLKKPGTVGRPISITELQILDDDGNQVSSGTSGWIYMKQGDSDFKYHEDPEKTAEVRKGKFVCVGDIGFVDTEGFLFLSGRDAEIIISGGVNIYPAAIEGDLLSHPAVRDAAIIGVPDEEFGEQVKGVVVLRHGFDSDERVASDLIEYCRKRHSHFSCPRTIDFVNSLPRDPTGKLYKKRIRDPYWIDVNRSI